MSEQFDLAKGDMYRDNYRKLLRYLLGLAVIAAILSALLVVELVSRGDPAYYATTTTGRIVTLNSLSEPIVTSDYILQWASLATRSILNLHFDNYQNDLQQASGYFNPAGWASFQAALKQSGMLDTIINDKLDASAIVNGSPVILDREVIRGNYTWRIQLPVLVTYTSASNNQQANFLVTMNVQRVPVESLATGIAISDISAQRLYLGGANNG